jgi:hypothetical protein
MMGNQDDIAIALDQIIPTERQGNGFPTPEEAAQYVDLGVAYRPVLMPGTIYPNRAVSKLQNGLYVIYDAGYGRGSGCNLWDVHPERLKIHRARFRLQQDLIYQDLVMGVASDREDAPKFFRHWSGGLIRRIMPWDFRLKIVPLYFPEGVFVPSQDNPLGQHVSVNYRYADGSIEVQCQC